MIMRIGVLVWLGLAGFLSYEYFGLNFQIERSLLHQLQSQAGVLQDFNLSPEPGRPLSLLLGWTGLTIILLTNLYVIRKRLGFLQGLGRLSNWLDFHILCGLIGPTLILFHCNFKVRGLVAVSFWSMLVSASSGILGRYFYVQLLQKKRDFQGAAQRWEERLEKARAEAKKEISMEQLEAAKRAALQYVGVPRSAQSQEGRSPGVLSVIFHAAVGDLRTVFGLPQTVPGLQIGTRYTLLEYGLAVRRATFYEPFQKLLGYWHTFHLPFAYFMYAAAVIHVAAALLFGVKK